MQAFKQLTSTAIPLNMNNVDTDMIIPAQFLTKINKEGYGEYLFQRLREQDPEFIFNNPHYQARSILLTRANFGCGSSREHAVWAIQQAGIQVIIAESYSDIFFNNAAKNGLLLITFPMVIIQALFEIIEKKDCKFIIDLEQQKVLTDNQILYFDYDPFRKTCLLQGHDDLDYLLTNTTKME